MFTFKNTTHYLRSSPIGKSIMIRCQENITLITPKPNCENIQYFSITILN